MCRTCGQGFSTSTKRDKHILSNACVRDQIVKKHKCSVCDKKFTMRKTLLAHETWCLYKQKRNALLSPCTAAPASGGASGILTDMADEEGMGSAMGDREEVDCMDTSLVSGGGGDASSSRTSLGQKERKKRAAAFKCTIHGCIM